MRYFSLLLLLFALPGCAEEDVLGSLLKKLDAEEYAERQSGEESIKKYFRDHPDCRWDIGKRLLAEKANPEVQSRIDKILHFIEQIDPLSATHNDDPLQDVMPGFGDENKINTFPGIVIVITSEDMMKFYRKVAQSNKSQEMPKTDFKNTILFAIVATGGIHSFVKELSCVRNFQKKESECHVVIGGARGGVAATFALSRLDLPLVISGTLEKSDSSIEVVRLDDHKVLAWDNIKLADDKDRNILALRKLAESASADTPAEVRHDFLRRSYTIDPLIPYVMLTHLALEYPSTFKEEYEYWKGKLPDSPVVGKLFVEALENGKRIVEIRK